MFTAPETRARPWWSLPRVGATAIALALVLALLGAASAQQQYVGTWYCRYANESLTNLPTDTWMYEFYFRLDQEMQFQAQGQYWANSAGYYDPFYASGQWQMNGDGFLAQGQMSSQAGIVGVWTMTGTLTGEGVITYRQEDQFNRLTIYCEAVPQQ